MSIDEALDNYNLKKFNTSIGDNLNRVTWQLYKSLDSHYSRILVKLNVRYDWDYIRPGSEIMYFEKSVCDAIKLPDE